MANPLRPHARRLPGDFSGSTWSGGKKIAHSGGKTSHVAGKCASSPSIGGLRSFATTNEKKNECMVKKLVVFVDVCCAPPNCREFV